jgi:hypothetical protein
MQQDKHIITKLQQLENQQLPDLSQMDSHWQQMQAMLVPAAPVTKTKHRFWLIPAAVLIIVTALLLNRNYNNNRPAATAITKAPSPRSMSPQTLNDTFVPGTWTTCGDTLKLIQQPPMGYAGNKRLNAVGDDNSDDLMPPSTPDTQYFNINFIPCIDSTVTDNKASNLRQQWLNELFAQLKKEPNQFIIDNRKDTTLFCQEGTALQIPAGSLGGNANIVFTVKEIYKKSDMVLNQLSATSNKALLESGGMLQLTATVNDQPVEVVPNQPITVYMKDTSRYMQMMQLFTGEKTTERLPSAVVRFNEKLEDVTSGAASTYMNWIPQYKYFVRNEPINEVRVLDLDDDNAKVIQRSKGLKGVFYRSPDSKFSKAELTKLLQARYGDTYYKIKVKNYRTRNWLGLHKKYHYGLQIGDSVWVDKQQADKRKWPYRATRNTTVRVVQSLGIDTVASIKMGQALRTIDNKYGINISRLGWINCDRFYNGSGENSNYVVQLGDSTANYYTLLVFNNINSVMNGYISGQSAIFTGVPVGMEVTVVSVGINKKGQAVYAMQKAITDKMGLSGITYQPAEAAALPNALSKLDK